jgi:quinol monooxygenase YgiN
MIVVRFKVRCQEGRTDDMVAAMAAVSAAVRGMDGVDHFDIGRDVTDSNSLIATEVFEDRAAMEREEALPEVARVVELLQSGALAAPPEWTVYEVASSESPQM